MAVPVARTRAALAGCDDGGPGFVNAGVRAVTNARQVWMRMQIKCACTHRHARVHASSTRKEMEQTGAWVRQVAQAMEEQLKEDEQELKKREQRRKARDAKRTRGIVHENDRKKRASSAYDEMVKLMHHDGQELLSLWEGWHWDDNKGGWLDPELCAMARRMCERVPR